MSFTNKNANDEPQKALRCKACKTIFRGGNGAGSRGMEAMTHSNYSGHRDYEWIGEGFA